MINAEYSVCRTIIIVSLHIAPYACGASGRNAISRLNESFNPVQLTSPQHQLPVSYSSMLTEVLIVFWMNGNIPMMKNTRNKAMLNLFLLTKTPFSSINWVIQTTFINPLTHNSFLCFGDTNGSNNN